MAKNLSLLMLLFIIVASSAMAQRIGLQIQYVDPTKELDGPHRSPVEIPEVLLDDHTLYFTTSCVGDTLQLVQNDVVVYSIVISDDEVELPASLEGTFEIRIIEDEWLFYGEIEL